MSVPRAGTARFEIVNPDPTIKPVTRAWQAADGTIKAISNLHDNHLGNIMRMIRDSAFVIRAMKIAEVTTAKLPKGKKPREAYEVRAKQILSSSWRDFLPTMFPDLEKDCRRRGLKWNNLTAEQEQRTSVTMSDEVARIFIRGKAALAGEQQINRTRAVRSVSI
jgi:hypothetical protein